MLHTLTRMKFAFIKGEDGAGRRGKGNKCYFKVNQKGYLCIYRPYMFFIFILFYFLATPQGMWYLSSLTRARTRAPCSGRKHGVLTTRPPGKSPHMLFKCLEKYAKRNAYTPGRKTLRVIFLFFSFIYTL